MYVFYSWVVTFTNFDAIFPSSPYYRDRYVETVGKNSTSYTPVGEKLFINCNRGKQSVLQERQLKVLRISFNFSRVARVNTKMPRTITFQTTLSSLPACLMRAFIFDLQNWSFTCLGLGRRIIVDVSRAQETLSSYGNGLQNNAFKSLINIHGIKGAAEWKSFCAKQLWIVSGITEHLKFYYSSGQNIVLTNSASKHGCPASSIKIRERSFFLAWSERKIWRKPKWGYRYNTI